MWFYNLLAYCLTGGEDHLIPIFHRGLSEAIQLELTCRDADVDLEVLMSLTIRLDQHLRGKSHRTGQFSHAKSAGGSARQGSREAGGASATMKQDEPEPMELGSSRLTADERRRKAAHRLCMYCGGSGHFLAACPARKAKVDVIPAPALVHNQLYVPVVLTSAHMSVSLFALIDSGSAGNFISSALVKSLGIRVEPLAAPVSVTALDGHLVSDNPVYNPDNTCMTVINYCKL